MNALIVEVQYDTRSNAFIAVRVVIFMVETTLSTLSAPRVS